MFKTREVICRSCSHEASYPVGMPDVQYFLCPKCGQMHEKQQQEVWVATARNEVPKTAGLVFNLGDTGQLFDKEVMLVGIVRLMGKNSTDKWDEYVFLAEDGAVYYLSEMNGKWMLSEEFDLRETGWVEHQDEVIDPAGDTFRLMYDYQAQMVFAMGFFNYKVSSEVKCREYQRPLEMVITELRNNQKFVFWGTHISAATLRQGFPQIRHMPPPSGIGAVEPFWMDIDVREFYKICGGFLVLILAISAMMSLGVKQQRVLNENYLLRAQDSVKSVVLPSIDLQGGRSSLTFYLISNVQNDWVACDFTLVNDVTQEERTVSAETAYYSGYEGASSWTEGDFKDSKTLCGVPSGRYHVVFQPYMSDKQTPVQVTIRATQNVKYSKNGFVAGLFLLIAMLMMYIFSVNFERTRWQDSPYSPFKS